MPATRAARDALLMAVVLVKLMAAALGKATLLKSDVNIVPMPGMPRSTPGVPGEACTKRILSWPIPAGASSTVGFRRNAVAPMSPSTPTALTVARAPAASIGRVLSGRFASATLQFALLGATRRTVYAPAGSER